MVKIKSNKILSILLGCLLLTCSFGYTQENQLQSADSLENAPSGDFQQLPDSLKAVSDSVTTQTNDTGFDTTLFYDARIIESRLDSNKFYLQGEAVVKYQKMTLTAARITVDQDRELLIAEGVLDTFFVYNEDSTEKEQKIDWVGTPVFTEGGEKLNGSKMIYNYRTQKGRVIRGRTDYESGKYFGEHIKKVEGKVLNVSHGYFTTCDKEDDPHFYFKARRMKIIPKKEVVAKPIVMYVSGIPVAYLPFVFFPNKGGRHSGILIPRYGESSVEGRYLQGLGYYWAPSEYFDLTTKFNYYDRSGWMADSRLRYKKRYVLEGNIAGSITKKEPVGGTKQNRWDLRIYHNQTINRTTKLRINGNFVSDKNYYRSYSSNINQRLNQQLTSNATLTKSWPESKNNLTINLRHSKSLAADGIESKTLPQISFYHSSRQLFPTTKKERRGPTVRRRDSQTDDSPRWYNSIYYSYNSYLINQTRSDMDEPVSRNLTHRASLSMNSPSKLFGWLGWNHGLNYNEIWFDRYKKYYFDADRDSTDTDSIKQEIEKDFASLRTFSYSASANTKIYGMFAPPVGNIVALRHVVSPSISFSYSPDFTDPVWGNYQEIRNPADEVVDKRFKYYGGSASTGQKRISFGIGNLFQMKTATIVEGEEQEKKFDLFTLNFSSGYNFEADSLRMGGLSSRFNANPTRNLSIRFSARHDFYKYDLNSNRVVNQFLPLEGKAPRLTYFSGNIGLRLSGKKKGGKRRERGPDEEELPEENSLEMSGLPGVPENDYRFEVEEAFTGLDIPWSANLSLDYSLSRTNPTNSSERFYLRISRMQVQLTKNWSISYQAQYDIMKRELVSQSFNFHRDLHCWEMTFRWVPSGIYKEYYLRINIKASQLKDIKVEKRGGRASHVGYGF